MTEEQRYRKIIHMDLDAFFCAVEALNNPELKSKPFAVGGNPATRGVVTSCSYAARQYGVHSAMPMAQAIRLCPSLIVIPNNHQYYRAHSQKVMAVLENYSVLVEKMSIDEAFVDVTDIQMEPGEIAKIIQGDIKTQTGLPTSFGVSVNKLVAKIANDYGKKQHQGTSYPEVITVVEPGKEKQFLAPLPVSRLWGVGEKTQIELKKIGLRTIGQLAAYDLDLLVNRFGKHGIDLHYRANGIDNRSIETTRKRKSLSQEVTFSTDIDSEVILRKTVLHLSEKIGSDLRHEGLSGFTIKIKYRFKDFSTFSRQITLAEPTNLDSVLFSSAWNLFLKSWNKKSSIRLIGVGVSKFAQQYQQLSLWGSTVQKEEKLVSAIDSLKDKYGKTIIQRAAYLRDNSFAKDTFDMEDE